MAEVPSSTTSWFVHPQALCESTTIGARTRIWAFAHVLEGARIGEDCNVCDHVFVEHDVVIGDRVTVKSGVQLWDGVRLADDVFVGPNATFSNDKYPRSRQYQTAVTPTHVGRGASIGAGAVILPGLRIGPLAMVGAGAVVTHDVPARAVVSGNPARIVGYVETTASQVVSTPLTVDGGQAMTATAVRGVTLHQLTLVTDLRGRLAAGEFDRQIPFTPRRYFTVFDVPGKEVRGEHAHRRCQQFLICIRGSVHVVVDDGTTAAEIELNDPGRGVFVPPLVWAIQFKYSADAVLLVFASDPYDADDYIRDYDEFLALVGR
jgi:acetyltransferase-like isoleucine patch superfamily enzyme/dTDP-4-dehydrorhamnose 3,5-epimerase-like enzyme